MFYQSVGESISGKAHLKHHAADCIVQQIRPNSTIIWMIFECFKILIDVLIRWNTLETRSIQFQFRRIKTMLS